MSRLIDRVPWIKKLGPLWKVLDTFDTVAGLWERIPNWTKRWAWRVIGFPIVGDLDVGLAACGRMARFWNSKLARRNSNWVSSRSYFMGGHRGPALSLHAAVSHCESA